MPDDPSSSSRSQSPDGASAVAVEVVVADDRWHTVADGHVVALVERAARAAAAAGAPGDGDGPALLGELSVQLADDARTHRLNRDWRKRDRPTNVLSFPAIEPDHLAGACRRAASGGPPVLLGDVVVAFQTTAREADQMARPLADHLTHLVVHGVLHLLGWDHVDTDQAAAMEALEVRILAGLGVADPYRPPDAGGGQPEAAP